MMSTMHADGANYYLPGPSPYPIILSVSLFFLALGGALAVNGYGAGRWTALVGAVILVYALSAWIGRVIRENRMGAYQAQVDRSFRWGMGWFIISEVVFFSSLFGVLFYERNIAVPWLASFNPHYSPWAGFHAAWPTSGPSGGPFKPENAWGIPALNTLILLMSGGTITWGLQQLIKGRRRVATIAVGATIALGMVFLALQGREFYLAYTKLHLTLTSGVYGATFYILTGFHGLHVTIGLIMLSVILGRCMKGHFGPEDHFGFEAVSWYWHFVDVVWLLLFVFVYWL
ncbi:MAG: cytochrome c oxidase subunit 3 [Gammaproteobacteria bacterium]